MLYGRPKQRSLTCKMFYFYRRRFPLFSETRHKLEKEGERGEGAIIPVILLVIILPGSLRPDHCTHRSPRGPLKPATRIINNTSTSPSKSHGWWKTSNNSPPSRLGLSTPAAARLGSGNYGAKDTKDGKFLQVGHRTVGRCPSPGPRFSTLRISTKSTSDPLLYTLFTTIFMDGEDS